ncbi:MAG: alpha/beta fold hydrolase [Rhizobiales bacterium]|nr:alpha/beta fold hydrolase [Hyphomicrobiales bacterium]
MPIADQYHRLELGTAALLIATFAAGCAPRPGPDVLAATGRTVPGAKAVAVYVATTRARDVPHQNVFRSGRADKVNFAEFTISVPPTHQPGMIEWPVGAPDPATTFATVQQSVLDGPSFVRAVSHHTDASGTHNVGVFVHGFNSNFQESLFRFAQMAADSDVRGTPILFAWPSEARVTGYLADKEAATFSRDALANLLTELARQRPTGSITVVAHSMGGWLTVEALRQLRLNGQSAVLARLNVILAAPDIDVDVFRQQMAVIGTLKRPLTVLVSPDDKALSLSGAIAGSRPRVGALNVRDPRVEGLALKSQIQIVDISTLKASDGFNHDRFVNVAALYPRLVASADTPGSGLRNAGAFVLNTVGTTLSAPFSLAGEALAGE